MKHFARIVCVMLACMLCISLVACNPTDGPDTPGGGETDPNETNPLVFSVQELDNVFNPFFGTSAYDNEITGNTQIAMLTSDAKGNVYCGADEPTVALNYNQTITYNGEEYDPALAPSVPNPENVSGDDYYTTYRFLIKNNIKFSDGKPLTINDVIFNMYAYLDPTYTGSSTMYSTDIKGLDEYRTQTEGADANEESQFQKMAATKAAERLSNIRAAYHPTAETRNAYRTYLDGAGSAKKKEILSDVAEARLMFYQELLNDWASAEASLEGFDEQFEFTEAWEIFLYNEGLITVTFDSKGLIDIDDVTGEKKIEYGNTKSWSHTKEDMIAIVFNNYFGITGVDYGDYSTKGGAKTDLILDEFGKATGSTVLRDNGEDEYFNRLYNSTACLNNVYSIVTYWATSSNLRDLFVAEAKQEYLSSHDMIFDTISGITVETVAAGTTFNGRNGINTVLTEDHYVLKVEINRVDPKAIWNFGFAVAPMHYYSNADNDATGKYDSSDDYRSFNYPGCPGYDASKPVSVGRPYGEKAYFDNVVKASNIISLPMGAGMYVASTEQGGAAKSFKQFCADNVVYYERNQYFYTTSGEGKSETESTITNCKIKYIRYKIINSTKLLDSILQGEIHYSDPQATQENVAKIAAQGGGKVTYTTIDNNGYGYIGVNAAFVPDLVVRRAIMHAMNLDLVQAYYSQEFASIIYRPISRCSWAYPESADKEGQYYAYDATGVEIEKMMSQATFTSGDSTYQKVGGIWQRKLNDGTVHKCEYTFTIAGSTDDHPAYTTMQNAADILNKIGFKITVKTDSQALSKLASGALTVWAAAWGSGIDPDMYQIYHMESAATSVKNWGYPDILNGDSETYAKAQGAYPSQKGIVEELSDLIDEARSMLDQDSRAAIYADALDLVMELAVELPTYQRKNLYAYRNDVIDITTLNKNTSPYSGPLAKMWEVSMVK